MNDDSVRLWGVASVHGCVSNRVTSVQEVVGRRLSPGALS